jgi:8-oxo-dGTP pyrophosphatase MutT (NUDIX family)
MCSHSTCEQIKRELNKLGFYGLPGVFGLIATLSYEPILGYERAGDYNHQLNLPGGKMDAGETCYLDALRRELGEEIKYCSDWSTLDAVFKRDGVFNYRFHMAGGHCAVIFLGQYLRDSQALVEDCNEKIRRANSNPNLPWCQRELAYIEIVRKDVNTSVPISRFALAVMSNL